MNKALFTLALLALPLGAAQFAMPDDGPALRADDQDATARQAAAPKSRPAPRNLAIFIFEGVQIIDYTGPYEVFGQAHDGGRHMFNVYTVAEKPGPITTAMGMTVVPKYTFDDAPKADIVVLPGGNVPPHMENPKVIKWVQDSVNQAEHAMSVCNGAFFLGKAGLLDGLSATTYYGLIDGLKTLAPKARVVTDQRFTDNGKIITTAGLSSGIDGALHLVEKLAGRGKAQEIALNMEYNWQPDAGYARASFADRHLRKVMGREGFKLPEGTGWKVLGQTGGRDSWEKNWEVRLSATAPGLLKVIDAKLAESWSKAEAGVVAAAAGGASDGAARSGWKFTDEEGKAWHAQAVVRPAAGEKNAYKLTIRLARGDASGRAQGQ
ncbi:MAG: DJ-1/PfpI family protein [Pyrinomonadaceae bacterium]